MGNTALCIMDVQHGIVTNYASDPGLVERIAGAAAAARRAGVAVIYVVVGFRPGHPEVSARNKGFAGLAAAQAFVEGDPAVAIAAGVQPQAGDLVVTKKRVSAFAGSDFELIVRSRGIDHLVLTGVSTSGVVLSTLRQAADLDFELTVLADCCGDSDAEVHRVLTEKLFPRQATVTTAAAWIVGLGA